MLCLILKTADQTLKAKFGDDVFQQLRLDQVIPMIVGRGKCVIQPAEMYRGPIDSQLFFDVKNVNGYVAVVIQKEEFNHD